MWDTKTLKLIKTIDVQGRPDGILGDPFNQHIYILSHAAPHVTVIDAKTGDVLGTIDLGGAPEQAATDGKGHVYIDVSDKANVAVVNAKTMTVPHITIWAIKATDWPGSRWTLRIRFCSSPAATPARLRRNRRSPSW